MTTKVMLHMVAPESKIYSELSAVDKCEYEVASGTNDGLRSLNFRQALEFIGKSVSAATLQGGAAPDSTHGLFNQASWVAGSGEMGGR